MANKNELKPCPFCGGQAEFVSYTGGYKDNGMLIVFNIRCNKCKAEYPKSYGLRISLGLNGQIETDEDQRKQALSDWNKRQGA